MAETGEQGITSMMEEKRVFKPSKELSEQAYIKNMGCPVIPTDYQVYLFRSLLRCADIKG